MKYVCILFLLLVLPVEANTVLWGKTGHRVIGEVAEQHLNARTKRAIKKLLNGESLALVSNYADDIKSDERYRKLDPWHYVNFSFGTKYGDEPVSEYGDIIRAIDTCITVIKDEKATDEDKAFYLKLLVHFIGDLHQPLHVGRAEDKGGNDIQVRWFNNGSNLHRVWDTDMIESFGMGYTELAANLPKLSKKEKKELAQGTVLDWVYESQNQAKTVYASAQIGEKLGYRYMYDHFGTVKKQLLKGGLRLAEVLNGLF